MNTAVTNPRSMVARRRVTISWARLASSFGEGGSGRFSGGAGVVRDMAPGLPRDVCEGSVPPCGREASQTLEGSAGFLGVLGATHGRQGVDEVPAVAGLGQARVEDGDHALVVGGADEAPRPLGQEGG